MHEDNSMNDPEKLIGYTGDLSLSEEQATEFRKGLKQKVKATFNGGHARGLREANLLEDDKDSILPEDLALNAGTETELEKAIYLTSQEIAPAIDRLTLILYDIEPLLEKSSPNNEPILISELETIQSRYDHVVKQIQALEETALLLEKKIRISTITSQPSSSAMSHFRTIAKNLEMVDGIKKEIETQIKQLITPQM